MSAPAERSRRVLVTGGTGGIGAQIARIMAKHDDVLVTGRSAGAGEGATLRVDQSDPAEAARSIAEACRARDGCDIAVLNAGTGALAQDGVEGAEAVRRTLDVNLAATVLIAHALAPMLLEARGTLVLIGSVARKGAGVLPSYSASKAGLHGFARALGEEWRSRASVLALHPGPTRTGMQGRAGMDVSRTEWAFVPSDLMARMIVQRIEAAHGRATPAIATLGHLAAARRVAAEWSRIR